MDTTAQHSMHQDSNDITADAHAGINIDTDAHAAIRIIKGDILHTPTPDAFEVCEDGYIIVADGTVQRIMSSLPNEYADLPVTDYSGSLIIPGFNDLHIHAPQYPMAGLGFDYELLPWLERYTFPAEANFADPEITQRWYKRFLNKLWSVGTLRFSAFATLHAQSTLELMRLSQQSGLRPVIGKVNMDRNAPETLIESTDDSLATTQELIEKSRELTPDIGFIITPRFVPSTTPELMQGLGELAERYELPVQSHLDENLGEIDWVRELHPDIPSYAEVYEHYGLMPEGRTIMAHCVHTSERERALLKARHVYLAHCAQSNMNLTSGIMPVRRDLDYGLNVTIASDVGAGHVPDINHHIVQSIEASKMLSMLPEHQGERPLRLPEAFSMATKAGGAFFGRVGSFEPGYDFDALVIREDDNPLSLSPQERLERYIYTGDDRSITHRFVAGREVPLPFPEV